MKPDPVEHTRLIKGKYILRAENNKRPKGWNLNSHVNWQEDKHAWAQRA